eukprot:278646_1
MSLWECQNCGLHNYLVENQCKSCFCYQSQNQIIGHANTIQIIKKQKKIEYYQYRSPLDMIPKRPLIVYGYIRKYKSFYPKEIMEMVYNFCFIKILNYQIKTTGNNYYETLTTMKTYQKQIKNVINGNENIYILFRDSTYEGCGYNYYGQLGINTDNKKITTF